MQLHGASQSIVATCVKTSPSGDAAFAGNIRSNIRSHILMLLQGSDHSYLASCKTGFVSPAAPGSHCNAVSWSYRPHLWQTQVLVLYISLVTWVCYDGYHEPIDYSGMEAEHWSLSPHHDFELPAVYHLTSVVLCELPAAAWSSCYSWAYCCCCCCNIKTLPLRQTQMLVAIQATWSCFLYSLLLPWLAGSQ